MANHREQRETQADGADFGFQRVGASEKQGLVRDVFERVAGRYDLMNDLMSWGVHRLWKAAMIDALAPRAGQTILDVAGGTGDIARRILDRVTGQAEPAKVIVVDLSPAMLQTGRDHAIDLGRLTGIEWVAGDAERLPLSDRSVDAYAIAFGLRNVTRIDRALTEARRVLRPGGRFVCLEFSRVNLPALASLYDVYSFRLIPALGEAVTGDRDAYRYLVESIRRFPAQEELAAMIETAGLDRVRVRSLSGGIAALHSAWKI